VNGTDKENRTVNLVKLDDYLRGVVPRESPASWGDLAGGAGMNALRAQAVAARSYSLGQKRYSYAKTCDTQSCQVYGGAALREKVGRPIAVLEDMRTNTAISDTSGFIMRNAKGGVVSTEFTSSNGGRTAGTTFPMRVDDGDIAADSSDLNWSAVIDAKSIQKKYPSIGVLLSVVTTHDGLGSDWNGYATKVTISGTAGVVSVSGWDFRSAFGLRSPWYETTPVYGSTATSTVVGPMLFIGDSVGESITSEFNSIVRPAYPNVDYQAQSSRCLIGATCVGTPDGITIINSLPADKTPAIAVIQLGYNDSSSTFGAEADQVVAALTAKGVQRIIFINMSTRRTTAGYDISNAALARIAATYANVTLFDWNTYSSDIPRWRWFVKNDNVHLTATGQTEFALYIRAQLDALRAQSLLPQTPGAPDVVIGLPLRANHRGDMVKLVQKSLNTAFKLKKKAIPTDGVFGKTTKTLVMKYEAAMALPVDGVVDVEVWKSLGLDKKPRTSVLRLGAKHPSVKVLQATLNRVLKTTVKTSGYYDRPTVYYVKQFQQRAKLPATGNVNRATWLALMTTADRL
jgi:SpoIID/LytB domain protein